MPRSVRLRRTPGGRKIGNCALFSYAFPEELVRIDLGPRPSGARVGAAVVQVPPARAEDVKARPSDICGGLGLPCGHRLAGGGAGASGRAASGPASWPKPSTSFKPAESRMPTLSLLPGRKGPDSTETGVLAVPLTGRVSRATGVLGGQLHVLRSQFRGWGYRDGASLSVV